MEKWVCASCGCELDSEWADLLLLQRDISGPDEETETMMEIRLCLDCSDKVEWVISDCLE